MDSRYNKRKGMTLLELIAAMAIFMVLVGALMVGTNNALISWREASSRSRMMGQGRAALGFIRADLLKATAITNNFELIEEGISGPMESLPHSLRPNRATFDLYDATPSRVEWASEGRVTWRLASTNNTTVLARDMIHTDGRERTTEMLEGVVNLRFEAVWEGSDGEAVSEISTNSLPAMIDVTLSMVTPQVLKQAIRINDETKKNDYIERHTYMLTSRIVYPEARLPLLTIITNMVTLKGRVFDGNRSEELLLDDVDFVVSGGLAETAPHIDSDTGEYRLEARQTARPLRITPKAPTGRSGRFTPPWRVWRPAAGSKRDADFVWRQSDLAISGKVTIGSAGGRPLEGALLDFPMAGQVFTDEKGEYSIGVDRGWPYSGERVGVTPVHPRYPQSDYPDSHFVAIGGSGAFHNYYNLSDNETGQDYYWVPPDLVITGQVRCAHPCNVGLQGVTVYARGDGSEVSTRTTDGGRYSLKIPFGWSGLVEAKWRWDVSGSDSDEGVGECLRSFSSQRFFSFENLEESVVAEFEWHPTAVISGEVWRVNFETNSLPLTYTLYSNCMDKVEIPSVIYTNAAGGIVGEVYPKTDSPVTNGTYALTLPHHWYHNYGYRLLLYINPLTSLSNGLHGVYVPEYAQFAEVPRQSIVTNFTWIPCEIEVSGVVTNAAGGVVTNQSLAFLSNCIAVAPTNSVTYMVLTNISETATTVIDGVTNITAGVTNYLPLAVFGETGNTRYPPPITVNAGMVLYNGTTAFAFESGEVAVAERLWVETNINGAFTNWVSYGWSGAIWPYGERGERFTPPVVFVQGVTSNLIRSFEIIDNIETIDNID